MKLERSTPAQPWGFSIEGGKGTEFYHDDPSIVITGISEKSPAYGKLRFANIDEERERERERERIMNIN
jgi:hypothetical protein